MDVDVSQEDDEPSESEAADRGRPAGRRKDAAVRDPARLPVPHLRLPLRANAALPARSGRNDCPEHEPAPETGGKPAAGSEAAAIVSNPAAEGNPADTVKKGQPAAAERERAAEASKKSAPNRGLPSR